MTTVTRDVWLSTDDDQAKTDKLLKREWLITNGLGQMIGAGQLEKGCIGDARRQVPALVDEQAEGSGLRPQLPGESFVDAARSIPEPNDSPLMRPRRWRPI